MKVQGMDGKLISSGVVNKITARYQAEEVVDAFRDLKDSCDEDEVVGECIMEVAGEEELLPVTTIKVSKNQKKQLQKLIDKMLNLYCSTGEGFINVCKGTTSLFI